MHKLWNIKVHEAFCMEMYLFIFILYLTLLEVKGKVLLCVVGTVNYMGAKTFSICILLAKKFDFFSLQISIKKRELFTEYAAKDG